jgi:hypothetical protein
MKFAFSSPQQFLALAGRPLAVFRAANGLGGYSHVIPQDARARARVERFKIPQLSNWYLIRSW